MPLTCFKVNKISDRTPKEREVYSASLSDSVSRPGRKGVAWQSGPTRPTRREGNKMGVSMNLRKSPFSRALAIPLLNYKAPQSIE